MTGLIHTILVKNGVKNQFFTSVTWCTHHKSSYKTILLLFLILSESINLVEFSLLFKNKKKLIDKWKSVFPKQAKEIHWLDNINAWFYASYYLLWMNVHYKIQNNSKNQSNSCNRILFFPQMRFHLSYSFNTNHMLKIDATFNIYNFFIDEKLMN